MREINPLSPRAFEILATIRGGGDCGNIPDECYHRPSDVDRRYAIVCADEVDAFAADIRHAVQKCVETISADTGMAESTSVRLLSILADDLDELMDRLDDVAADVYVPVRMLDGINDHSVHIFQDTLAEAGAVIGYSDPIPRPVACVLVNTFSAVDFQGRSEHYNPAELRKVSIAAKAILKSVREWIR